jgi:uncharacterized protein (DUF433 family)
MTDGEKKKLLRRITTDPKMLGGKPIVRGTSTSVESILGLLAVGWDPSQIIADHAGLTDDDIRACIAYAEAILSRGRK